MIGLGFDAQLRFQFVCNPLPFLGFGVFYSALVFLCIPVKFFVTYIVGNYGMLHI